MGEVIPLVQTSELKTEKLRGHIQGNLPPSFIFYDDLADHLIIILVPTTSSKIAHYLDSHIALLYEMDTMEIIGIQIEAFEHSFIKNHESLELLWVGDNPCPEDVSNFGNIANLYNRKNRTVWQEVEGIARPKIQESGLEYA